MPPIAVFARILAGTAPVLKACRTRDRADYAGAKQRIDSWGPRIEKVGHYLISEVC